MININSLIDANSLININSLIDANPLSRQPRDHTFNSIRYARPSDLPGNYLLPNRAEGEDCPVCEGKVKKIKINGRGAYFCPNCQKR